MIECYEAVAEEILMLRDAYPIVAFVFIHPRQTSPRVRLPRINYVSHVLRRRHLSQILDAIVKPVAIDVVNLQCRKTPVVPSPHRFMHLDNITFARDNTIKIQIMVFTVS